jgi:hypothetical protein
MKLKWETYARNDKKNRGNDILILDSFFCENGRHASFQIIAFIQKVKNRAFWVYQHFHNIKSENY